MNQPSQTGVDPISLATPLSDRDNLFPQAPPVTSHTTPHQPRPPSPSLTTHLSATDEDRLRVEARLKVQGTCKDVI